MRRNPPTGDEISRLWRRHQQAGVPDRLRAEEVAGVDLAEVEVQVGGCVDAWRAGSRTIDEDRRKVLVRAVENLEAVLPLLRSRAESLYVGRLHQLAVAVLAVR